MKLITKYQKADKFVNSAKLLVAKMTGNKGLPLSKAFWIKTIIRQAYLKGYKAGRDRQRRIHKKYKGLSF